MVSVLALLLVSSVLSYGAINETVSKERAKELGATVRTKVVGTNQVGVWLEFAPKGRLQNFCHADLAIGSCDRTVVTANLSPLHQSDDSVLIYFSTDPANLQISTLFVFCKSNGDAPFDIFRFNVGDFVAHDFTH
jgi:hypothetical protein